jgi:hypothetical protein
MAYNEFEELFECSVTDFVPKISAFGFVDAETSDPAKQEGGGREDPHLCEW